MIRSLAIFGAGLFLCGSVGLAFWLNRADPKVLAITELQAAETAFAANATPVDHFPLNASADCNVREDAIYAPCRSQAELFNSAIKMADETDRIALISLGGNWCFWCFVLNNYWDDEIEGLDPSGATADQLDQRSDQVQTLGALNAFVSETFVIAHIDTEGDGMSVVEGSGAMAQYSYASPYIFTVDAAGQFQASMANWQNVDGFFAGPNDINPAVLLQEMKALADRSINP